MAADLAHEGKFQHLARFGFLVRGLLYIVIALLVLRTGRTEDLAGAMEYLNRGFGRGLMIFLVAGMIGYGLWRLADASFGMDSGRHHAKAWRSRIAAGFSGAIYLLLAYKALRIMLEGHSASGGPQQNAATAMHLPSGQYLLAAAALVGVGAGVVQLYKAATCSFLDNLDWRAKGEWVRWLGRVGYAARGVVFITVGLLLGRAALDRDPAQAGGLEQALDVLRGPAEYAVAAGLFLFGVFSIIEARFRSINKPPTGQIRHKVDQAIGG